MSTIILNVKKLLSWNIQLQQTLGLSVLLTLGVTIYGLNISLLEIFVTFFSVIVLDGLLIKYETGEWIFPRAGVNAGFGISFFLRSEDLIIYFFAALLAILSKRLLRVDLKNNFLYKGATEGRHFLNPSNSAVFLTLVLFPYLAWTNPLQWGQSVSFGWYLVALLAIFIAGVNIEYRMKKIINIEFFDVILAVLLTHVALFLLITNESMESALLFFNGAFLIFIFFQITDPKTIPERKISRILYGIAMGILFYVLWYFINENYSLLASLFFMTLLLPTIWKYDNPIKNKLFTKTDKILLTLIFFMIVGLGILIYLYGIPDLVFNNRCNQLFCRNFNFF